MTALLPAIETASRFVVAIMLNSIWEDAFLVLAVWFLLRSMRDINASTRYFSWLVTLVAAVILPVVTSLPQIAQVPAPVPAVQTGSPVTHARVTAAVRPSPIHVSTASSQPPAVAAPKFRLPERLHLVLPNWLAAVLFGAWLLAALVTAVRLAVDLYKLEALKRDSLPLPVEYRDQMERWVTAAYGNPRDVRLCVSERIEVPVAVGLFDSMILLPKHLLAELDAGELDRISLHELAHLHRSDDWTNSVQRFVQILMFFNPAIRFIGSQLDLEREVACDDWVLALTGEVRPYATCLTKMAELTAWPHRALAAPGVFVTRKGISIRIERLLNKHRNARVKVAYGVPSAVAGALVLLFAVAAFVTPVIAYTTEPAATTVAGVKQKVYSFEHKIIRHKQAEPAPPPPVVAVKPHPAPTVRTITRTILIPEVKTTVKMKKHVIRIPAGGSVRVNPNMRPLIPNAPLANVPPVDVHVPAIDVNVPETNVHVPAIHVHVPAMLVRAPHVHPHIPGIASADGFVCTGCNFSHVDWSGKDMSNRSYVGSDFEYANLQGTNFSGSQLSGVNFAHANLRNANFTNARMSGCDLRDADITGARFDGAQISGCGGVNPRTMDQSQLRAWLNHCSGCDFANADLHGMDLRGVRLSGISLRHANLRGADLSDARLSGVDLGGADLTGARLSNARFSGCDFDRTDLRNVDLSTASFSGSDMSGAIMR